MAAAPGSGPGAGFRSKSDMINSAFNPIQREAIWREHVIKEKKGTVLRTVFMANPNTVRSLVVTDKVTRSNPYANASSRARQDAKRPASKSKSGRPHSVQEKQSVYRSMVHQTSPSKNHGVTTNSKYGSWNPDDADARLLSSFANYYPKHQCAMTEYAERHIISQGFNPFASPDSGKNKEAGP